jgi:hypothetical protein
MNLRPLLLICLLLAMAACTGGGIAPLPSPIEDDPNESGTTLPEDLDNDRSGFEPSPDPNDGTGSVPDSGPDEDAGPAPDVMAPDVTSPDVGRPADVSDNET